MRNSGIIFSICLVVLAAPPVPAKEFGFDYQKVVSTGPEAEVTLNYVSGKLTVIGGDDDKVIIEAHKRVSAVSMDEAQVSADHIEIKVDQRGKQVDIVTNYLRMSNRSQSFWKKVLGAGGEDSFGEIDWVIQVPQHCKLTVVNISGKIEISHLIGGVEVRSSASEVSLTSIEGSVRVENTSGSVTGELLFGPIDIRQAGGRIDLKFLEGDVRIKSSTADISISQDNGSLDLTTASGNVDIQTNLDSSRDYFVTTESGHIRLMIPETSSGDLRIKCQTGDIRTEIPIAIRSMSHKQVEGTFGFGGAKINLTSVSGDVTVAQF
ncbi:MAG: DUF4097 family beta strand repeat-containing protein [candidate division Zixibacteria bacterium]|nr:DUF4097 family beta strand repeat-containing protein [candidate division Zixibacteria bacterium]